MSVFAKLFSIISNNMLVKFAENSSQFNDFQYGFREKRSTTDCIFILHNMIKCTLDKKKKNYTVHLWTSKQHLTLSKGKNYSIN